MGQVKDALALASAAHHVNDKEPKTNILLGLLHLHFGNYSVAVHHFDSAFKAEPDSMETMENFKLVAACHAIEKKNTQHLQCQGVDSIDINNLRDYNS